MILDDIIAKTKIRVRAAKERIPLNGVIAAAARTGTRDFFAALKKPGLSFICEVKKASPSKGVISADFKPVEIAREYEAGGADAVSVLTEPDFFMGANGHLTDVASAVRLPVLRKDFIIDEYQIYEARAIGADAVLLICAALDARTLKDLIGAAHASGMSALVETRSESEIETALKAGARIIGVNNRDLTSFAVDKTLSLKLRRLVPKEIPFVSESGISAKEDILALEEGGADAVLVGEALMRAKSVLAALTGLRGV
ncbi:MAG: indole-3-glycerol phosphate synthase TrpC [Clostridiales bacterium]|jgi:indole-3-glycerol phosphate synthase|nr:indole-3-glycerol phosphate synthase TrpC [Clostridiales bacterium]